MVDKLFLVTNEKNGDGWNWRSYSPIQASNKDEAATLWAEEYDCGDYSIVGGSPETVAVKIEDESGFTEFEVHGEMVPIYRTVELV